MDAQRSKAASAHPVRRASHLQAMSKWVEEEIETGLRVGYRLKKILDSSQSEFQTVDLVDLEPFGRCVCAASPRALSLQPPLTRAHI